MVEGIEGCRYCDLTYNQHAGVCHECARVRIAARGTSGRRMDMTDHNWRDLVRKERKLDAKPEELKAAEADKWVYRLTAGSLRRLENGFSQTDEGKGMSPESRAEVRSAMLRLADELLKR
jgi:hypothetical protein